MLGISWGKTQRGNHKNKEGKYLLLSRLKKQFLAYREDPGNKERKGKETIPAIP